MIADQAEIESISDAVPAAEAMRDLASDKDALLNRLDREIARIDRLLTRQVNEILHSPRFQALEAAWRGLKYLTEQVVVGSSVKIRILSLSWSTLAKDIERAVEFDQSQFFKKIYTDGLNMPGGEPFSVLIGVYEIRRGPSRDHRIDDLMALNGISRVAAAAFAPFIAAAHPTLFGLDGFHQLRSYMDFSEVFAQLDYLAWNRFRAAPDARFIGLTLPRILMREPYADDGSRLDGFRFQERVNGSANESYLWGNAAFAFASVLIRAFAVNGWLADIRGVGPDRASGGLVNGLPSHSFSTDKRGTAPKGSTDATVTDYQDREFADLGFIPLCRCQGTPWSAFFSTPSVQRPETDYDRAVANVNARLSAMLHYILCVSRFGHYVKVIGRDKLGKFGTPEQFERFLHGWLLRHVISTDTASFAERARFPLREASVQVREQPGKPGSYLCVMHLRPHFQLEQAVAAVKLVTELSVGSSSVRSP